MPTRLEDLLPSAAESERGEPRGARAVYQRLQFLARVMQHAPAATGCRALLLWLDEQGRVSSAVVGAAGAVIGREATCDVVLTSLRVSRRHCAVRWANEEAEGNLVAEDLNSSNGTMVNGRPITAYAVVPVRDGDVIEVGGMALAVVLGRNGAV